MKTALLALAGVFAGLLVTVVLLVAVEVFSAIVHPFPEGFEGTKAEICRHVERYPPWVLAVCLPAWAFAAFSGTWIAQRIGNLFASAPAALLILAALTYNISMLPYPPWFKIAGLLVIPAALAAGIPLARRRTTGGDEAI